MSGRVGTAARVLGFAGLLPQVVIVAWMAAGERDGWLLATIYALAILSFLGGIWWGLAMRIDAKQGVLAALAVSPSLIAVSLAWASGVTFGSGWVLVAIGAAIMLTLPVDRWLATTGVAPEGWMALRVPLSIGLGMLTIAAGAPAGG